MSCPSIMFSLVLISPCTDGGGEDISEAVQAALGNPNRPAEDVLQDKDRKPGQVLTFFGIEPGMNVIEALPGGGWYTKILAPVLAKRGQYIAAGGLGKALALALEEAGRVDEALETVRFVLVSLPDDRDLREAMGRRALELVEPFTVERMMTDLDAFYQRLLV